MNEARNIKKLFNTTSYIRSIFKNYTAHSVQDVFQLHEAMAACNGCIGEAKWKHVKVNRLLKDLTFMSVNQVIK